MSKDDDKLFPQLISAARFGSVSFNLNFSEIENVYEFEIISAAPSERYYAKRIYSIEECIKILKEKTNQK